MRKLTARHLIETFHFKLNSHTTFSSALIFTSGLCSLDFHAWDLHACCFLLKRSHSLSCPGALWVLESFMVSCTGSWLWSGTVAARLPAAASYHCKWKHLESLSNISSPDDSLRPSSQTCVQPAHVAPPIVTFCPSSLWPPLLLYWLMTKRTEVPTVTCCTFVFLFTVVVQTFFFFLFFFFFNKS